MTDTLRVHNHRLLPARQLLSPNRDARPDIKDISLIVVHSISLPPGEFGGDYVNKLFQGEMDSRSHPIFETLKGVRVSSHLLLGRQGNISQFVPFNERAWHAGISCFQGRDHCNDFSIGIELEGDQDTPYTEHQYSLLAKVVSVLMATYPGITSNRLVGHSDIAPGRKTDPGPCFDWQRLHQRLKSFRHTQVVPTSSA